MTYNVFGLHLENTESSVSLCSSKEKTGSNNYNYGTIARKQIQVYFASLLDFIVTRFEKLRSQDIL